MIKKIFLIIILFITAMLPWYNWNAYYSYKFLQYHNGIFLSNSFYVLIATIAAAIGVLVFVLLKRPGAAWVSAIVCTLLGLGTTYLPLFDSAVMRHSTEGFSGFFVLMYWIIVPFLFLWLLLSVRSNLKSNVFPPPVIRVP